MRYNKRIEFIKHSKEEYDAEVGEYTQGTVIKKAVPCFVMDIGIQKSMELFGNYEKDRKQVYLRQSLKDKFDKCILNDKTYKIIKPYLSETVLYLESDISV